MYKMISSQVVKRSTAGGLSALVSAGLLTEARRTEIVSAMT
jgi:hypothetical protein